MRNKILPLAEKTERTKEWVSHRTRTYCTTSHSHCSTESIIKNTHTHTHTERSEKEHKHATVLFHLDKRIFFFNWWNRGKRDHFNAKRKNRSKTIAFSIKFLTRLFNRENEREIEYKIDSKWNIRVNSWAHHSDMDSSFYGFKANFLGGFLLAYFTAVLFIFIFIRNV